MILGLVACGSTASTDDSGGGLSSDEGSVRTAGEEPPGTDADAVAPYLDTLLSQYDDLVHELTLDPQVAHDDDHPSVAALHELFSEDSHLPDQLLERWAENYGEPPQDERPALISELGEVSTVSEDEVSFGICASERIYAYDDETGTVRGIGYEDNPVEGTAVRVEGVWVLQDMYRAQGNCNAENEE